MERTSTSLGLGLDLCEIDDSFLDAGADRTLEDVLLIARRVSGEDERAQGRIHVAGTDLRVVVQITSVFVVPLLCSDDKVGRRNVELFLQQQDR